MLRYIYTHILKPVFFRIDPETTHNIVLRFGVFLGKSLLCKKAVRLLFFYKNKILEQKLLGIHFENPVGLAAGFDKNAELVNILPPVGFGFEEIGSVTARPCVGNPKPRLWRLKKSKSLIVNYGLANLGAKEIIKNLSGRIHSMGPRTKKFEIPIGISIAKTNSPDTVRQEDGVRDYVESARLFRDADIGDYITLNISCPNAYGGEPFTDPDRLTDLLTEIKKLCITKPVFIKLPAQLTGGALNNIMEVAESFGIDGYICSNLFKGRDSKKIYDSDVSIHGGISGKVVEDVSTMQVTEVYKKTGGKKIVIGCGGIFSAEDAYKKIRAGASLVQLITGMIFEGPQLIGEINRGLVELLRRDGYSTISDAVGKDVIW